MKSIHLTRVIWLALVLCRHAGAQIYDTNGDYVQTFAGSAFTGYLDGVGQLTMFFNPSQIVSDSKSNLFVLDSGNQRIRKITPDGTVSTFAGGGASLPGLGTNAALSFASWSSMAIDHHDTIWLASGGGGFSRLQIYQITSNAAVTSTTLPIFPALCGICLDSLGNAYLVGGDNKIYRYTTNGVLVAFVGSGNQGSIDGNGVFTSFNNPTWLAVDKADNIYVWDSGNYVIRRINQNADVVTIAGHYASNTDIDGVGTNAAFGVYGISAMLSDDSGNLLLACGNCIREMSASTNVTTLAGGFGPTGYTNGPGNLALFGAATGICISGGTIFVADAGNQRIRSITNNPQAQVVSGANLGIATYPGVTITGIVGRTYQVQTSPDETNWTSLTTLLLTSSPYLWIDQNPVSGNKFYRAVLLP